ncbi:MAG: ATP phosphoribosyltransferase regulatory subunit [Clostridia bacterium]|nr:ATP phosphoribosyltransferase regulatory subunit [Clostridia bacterium]
MNTPAIIKQDERAIFALRSLYRSFGYSQFKMSKFEEYDLYVRNKSFLVSDHIITFTDTNGKLMALKPDVTLSIVKNSKDTPDSVQKVYYDENVYRVSAGRDAYREIMQAGLECIGAVDNYCIAEVLTLAVKSLSLISPDFVLDVSHLGILSAVLDSIPVSLGGRAALVRCVGEKNLHGIDEICISEGIDPKEADALKALVGSYGAPADVITKLEKLLDEAAQPLIKEFSEILSAIPTEHIRIDFSVVNDLGYYNGIVFGGFVRGIPQSILSGGQYDNLMKKMGRRSRAIGFALYLDLLEELEEPRNDYDVDTVLLYDGTVDLSLLTATVSELTQKNDAGVLALRSIPKKLRYRTLLKLTAKGLETADETHA